MITTESTPEEVGQYMDAVAATLAAAKRQKQQCDDAVIEWIRANGDLVIGDVRWYVAKPRTVKCPDVGAVLSSMLERVDIEHVVNCLSADCWKQGAVRSVLGDAEHRRLFKITRPDTLKAGKLAKARD